MGGGVAVPKKSAAKKATSTKTVPQKNAAEKREVKEAGKASASKGRNIRA
jgi:hypothetical protein